MKRWFVSEIYFGHNHQKGAYCALPTHQIKQVQTHFHNFRHGIFTYPPPQVSGEMMETAKKIFNAENAMHNLACNQTENAKKIQHKSHKELPKNQTAKILPFSVILSFENAKKISGLADKCYETVKIIIPSFDFHLNKTTINETPKDISNFIVFSTAQI